MAYFVQPPFHQNVPRVPSFLTDRIEHARYVLSSCLHPFNARQCVLNQLPVTIVPPLPATPMTLKEMKDYKERMYEQYTALYWKRAMEKIRAEREHQGDMTEVVGGTIRYTRGFVHRGVYSLYSKSTQFQPPLVSESAMESILDLIPPVTLGFYPPRKYLSSMELSLKGLSRSVFVARENAAYYFSLLHQLIMILTENNINEFDVEATKNSLHQFLEVSAPKVNYLFDHAFNYLKTEGEDPHKLNVLALYNHSFLKFYERLKYVYMVLKLHGCYDTHVVGVIEDLGRFQHALRSIRWWKPAGNVYFY